MLMTLASNVVVAQVWQEPALHVMLRDARVGWHGRQPWQEPAQLMSMARVGWHGRPALAKTSATDAPDARFSLGVINRPSTADAHDAGVGGVVWQGPRLLMLMMLGQKFNTYTPVEPASS